MNLQDFRICDDAMFALAFDHEPAFFEEVWRNYVDKSFHAEKVEMVFLETVSLKGIVSAVGIGKEGTRRECYLMFFDDDLEEEFHTYMKLLQLAEKNRQENGYDVPWLLLMVKNCDAESRLNHLLLTDQKVRVHGDSHAYEFLLSVINLPLIEKGSEPSIYTDFYCSDPDAFYFKPLGEKYRYLKSLDGLMENMAYWVMYESLYKIIYFHKLKKLGHDKETIMDIMKLDEKAYVLQEDLEEKMAPHLDNRAEIVTGGFVGLDENAD